ncbi:MAG: peptide deformylase, partial [Planctomycetia bacterium]
VAKLGQPMLRKPARPVPIEEIDRPEFQLFLDDLLETMSAEGGVGLAAPQVFDDRRVFLAAVGPEAEPDGNPSVVIFINPVLVETSSAKRSAWEGCLSFIELLVLVPRHRRIVVDFLDREARPCRIEAAGFAARVVQHEYDHLDGVLTIDRAASTRDIVKASEIDSVEPKRPKARDVDATPSD